MSDFTLNSSNQLARDRVDSRPRSNVLSSDRFAGLRAVLALFVAVSLVVPESEIRQKLFKANLIVKNLARHRL